MSGGGGPWSALLPAALVGTERHAAPLPAWSGEAGEAIAAAAAGAPTPAVGVLRAAAVIAVCSRAGTLGVERPSLLPEPARAETRAAPAGDAWLARLAWALHDGPPRLLPLLCAALDRAGQVLPPPVLPAALDAGRRSVALRASLRPVLGERGRWLATRRDDWRWAAGPGATTHARRPGLQPGHPHQAGDPPDESPWQDGTLEQRRDFLRAERARDPAAARGRLAAALPGLPARERAELLAELAHGLGPDDEPLLDAQRADRSAEVRRAALDLLLRLPGAAHPTRAAARLSRWLARERGLLLLRRRWTVDAPAAVEPDWADDNVDALRPKHETLGERAWWLAQLVRQVPLGWWTSHTAMMPAELRRWADTTDWADALLRGWRDVLLAAPDDAWTEAFVEAWPRGWPTSDRSALLARLPLARREGHWQRAFGSDHPASLLPQVLAGCAAGETLSAPFSAVVAAALRRMVDAGALQRDWTLRPLLAEAACVLHASALPALAGLRRAPDEPAGLAEAMRALDRTVELRQALDRLPPSSA